MNEIHHDGQHAFTRPLHRLIDILWYEIHGMSHGRNGRRHTSTPLLQSPHILLAAGANPTLADGHGKHAAHKAISVADEQVVGILAAHDKFLPLRLSQESQDQLAFSFLAVAAFHAYVTIRLAGIFCNGCWICCPLPARLYKRGGLRRARTAWAKHCGTR